MTYRHLRAALIGFTLLGATTAVFGQVWSQGSAVGVNSSGILVVNTIPTYAFVTADFTTTSVTLVNITGLSFTLPANQALNLPFHCELYYSQATAAAADSFGAQTSTVTPSNFQVGGAVETALGTTAYGDVTITNTTAQAVVTATPSAITTIFNAYLGGFIENPSNASTTAVTFSVLTGAGTSAITVKRGSWCRAG